MIRRRWIPVAVTLVLLLGVSGALWGQQVPWGNQEYNDYIATTRIQDPAQRLQEMDKFIQTYPKSLLRAFIYPSYINTAFGLKKYDAVRKAADDFLSMDHDKVEGVYQQSNYKPAQIDATYYQVYVLYTYSFLQGFHNGTPDADAQANQAAKRAREGLELFDKLYSEVQPPTDEAARQQFEQNKQQQESAFHSVLAFVAWRDKDYATAAKEYKVLVGFNPGDVAINYRLGLASLQTKPANYEMGYWYLARSVALNPGKSGEVKAFLTKSMAAHEQVLPECLDKDVDQLIQQAGGSADVPAGFSLPTADQVNAVRADMNLKRILDDLKAGGEQGHLMWLASCGSELGVAEDGSPTLNVLVVSVTQSEDNVVTLQVAAGQEAADSKTANMEVKVTSPPEAKKLKADDVVRISGRISGYETTPTFMVKLDDGKVNPADIPKMRR